MKVSGLHRPTLTALVQSHGWTHGAELGVDKGILFGMLLRQCPRLNLIGVDTFPDRQRARRVWDHLAAHNDRAEVWTMTTRDASTRVEDGSLDFVFIDADHSAFAVSDDITHWRPKVRRGGWLGGHDYSQKFPGVVVSVDRFFGPDVETYPGHIWGVWQ